MSTLRFAWRSLLRSPVFVAVAVLALALGLGLSTTMFAVLDAVVNPYMPYRDPDALFTVHWWFNTVHVKAPPSTMLEAVQAANSFEAVVPIAGSRLAVETADDYWEVFTARVSPQFFEVTGVRPRLGRGFVASDGEDVVVLSDGLWRRVFPRRRSLTNATITLGGRRYAVIGVMPNAAVAPNWASAWLPLSAAGLRNGAPMVRLKAGITKDRANAELKAISARLTATFTTPDYPIAMELVDVRERGEELRDIHKAMVGAALSVLLIACVNLAHLMLARGLSKRRELALRMAIGASRAQVVRQMFAECAIITGAGAVLGGLAAWWGSDVLANRMPPEVLWIGFVRPQLSWRVFALSALAAVLSAVVFGLLPAIRVALAVDVNEPLKDGAGTTVRQRQRYSPLVAAEVGLALVLMMGGGLLLRTVQRVRDVQYTFDTSRLLEAHFSLLRGSRDSSAIGSDAVLSQIAAIPGVQGVAIRTQRFTPGGGINAEHDVGDSARSLQGGPSIVSWNYLQVQGLPVIQGRGFEPGDSEVAIVNPGAAQRLFPRGDAVGRMIQLGKAGSHAPWVRIIGISRGMLATDVPELKLKDFEVWVAARNRPVPYASLLIRTERDDPAVAVAVRRRLLELPGRAWASVAPYDRQRQAELSSRGFLAKTFVSMGSVALALAALGLYGVLAYAVGQRMREFAVRLALGAETRQLFRMVLHDGAVMLLAGIGVGAFAALFAARLLDAVLVFVLPSDVVSLVLSELVLVTVGLAAALGPARRAARANPLDIMRAV